MAKTTTNTTTVVKSTTVTDVIKVTTGIGDKLTSQFDASGDIKVLAVGLDAYKTAISGSKAQLIYKKLTGKPTSIPFLED